MMMMLVKWLKFPFPLLKYSLLGLIPKSAETSNRDGTKKPADKVLTPISVEATGIYLCCIQMLIDL
jgi:hypothetical protein